VLVAPGDSAALAAAVGALLADPDTARRHAEAGRERMLAEFSATAMTDRTLALYRAIVPRRP
jgi:glycosyltransferase involved in cell wall biosynthesis